MADPIHPNAAGHAHMTEKWSKAFDAMLGAACGADR
jgi:hypothetical protein